MGKYGIFDIVGPIMIGPSSSHTAGAARIGLMAGQLTGYHPLEVTLQFHGSLAEVYHTHFTDAGVLAGLMGFRVDDERIRHAFDLAKAKELYAASGAPADLTLTLLAQSQPPSTGLVCQVIQAQLAELGITVEIVQVDPPVFNTEKTDPTKWDLSIDASAGGDYVYSPWALMFDQERYNGTTSNWFKDDQLQTLLAAAKTDASEANVDAAWQYIKEQDYMQGLFSYVNNIVSISSITGVYLDKRGFVVPGACEYKLP